MSLISDIRVDIGDDNVVVPSGNFSDTQLVQIVTKAARRVNRDLSLFGKDNEIVINPLTGEITSIDDGTFDDLVLMQAECMISQREFNTEINDSSAGRLIKDGEQTLDTKAKGVARGKFFDSSFGPCALYKEQIVLEKIKRTSGYDIW